MVEPTREQLVQEYATALAMIDRLRTSRDALLTALKDVCESAGPSGTLGDGVSVLATAVVERASAAVTRAEGRE